LKLKNLEKTKTSTPSHYKKFYPRIVNKTDITFNADELDLLNKGLKYNLSLKRNNWIETLSLEAETAVSKLPILEQDCIRYQVAHNIKLLYKQQHSHKDFNTKHAIKERRTLNNIKNKLTTNNALALKADKR
jgi:hypothetical protein